MQEKIIKVIYIYLKYQSILIYAFSYFSIFYEICLHFIENIFKRQLYDFMNSN